MTKDVLTAREKIALKILRAMFLIVAPYQDHNFKNESLMKDLFND